MYRIVSIFVIALFAIVPTVFAQDVLYKPTWESIDSRPIPAWFDEVKFGIFIHWGVYAVPSWCKTDTYSEWYWNHMQNKEGETWKFHLRTYGEKVKYQDFAPQFKAELFEPDQWADIFVRSGAKYVVLTSKHHDGFCLWPSAESWNWNSVDIGPHRDLCGDLTKAVKDKGLKMGFYYSLYEWFNPLYKADVARYVDEHMMPQFMDLVERYEPSILFSDGEWDHPSDVWKSTEFLAWLYNEAACREEVVVDDRWGEKTRGRHGGYYTTEYGNIHNAPEDAYKQHKWEECRGIGASFGYNRNETIDHYETVEGLVHLLIELVCKGGNLLLDIGPTADGRIPVIMQDRLIGMGKWLETNGEAIYGTRPWKAFSEGESIRYTAKGDAVYAISLKWPGPELILETPKASGTPTATLLGYSEPLKCETVEGRLRIEIPPLSVDEVPCEHAYTIKLVGIE